MTMFVVNTSGKSLDFMEKRHKFSMEYCRKQGWPEDPAKLSIEQIMEIRKQPEWIDAGKD